MLTVFANMYINSDERFEHLKDSFASFESASDDWLINIRGKKRAAVNAFLRERLGSKVRIFELLDDERGWTRNAVEIVRYAKHPYVLVWLEDHMCVVQPEALLEVVAEMEAQHAEYLQYSFFEKGAYTKRFDVLELRHGEAIDTVTIGLEEWRRLRAAGRSVFLVSLVGIFEKGLLERLLQHDGYMLPPAVRSWLFRIMAFLQRCGLRFNQKEWYRRINWALGFKLRRQSKETPHDFEKGPDRYDVLPIRTALPHRELFACMDDDDNLHAPYSLMTRGLYPVRNNLETWKPATLGDHIAVPMRLAAGEKKRYAYCCYGGKGVRHILAREYLRVVRGKLRVRVRAEELELSAGEGARYFTNVPFEIEAVAPAEIERLRPALADAVQLP